MISEPVWIVLFIAGTAWLVDRLWPKPSRPVKDPPKENNSNQEDSQARETRGPELHPDWMRLERRQKR